MSRRRFPHPVKIVGFGSVIYGAGMTLGPDSGFRAPTYETAFLLLPRQLWGTFFLVAGLGVVIRLCVPTAQLLSGVLFAWAGAIGFETAHRFIVDGETASLVAPTWATVSAASLLAVAEWFGLDDR